MKSRLILFSLFFISTLQFVSAQEIDVTVSYDTVYAGNMLGVRYSMENWQADLSQPDFGKFEFAGGPQITSSTSIVGGERSSSKSITFYLKPPEEPGVYKLPAQIFRGEGKEVESPEKSITVLDNLDGIQQNPAIETGGAGMDNRLYRRKAPQRGQRQRF